MKINVLKGEKYEVDPEDIKVSFNDVKGVGTSIQLTVHIPVGCHQCMY
jgi:hypothetical protein